MSARSGFFSGFVPQFMAIVVAAAGCIGAAFWAKEQIEEKALVDLNLALSQAGHDWTDITVDGLSVQLTGTAPDEATRFAALSIAGTVVDTSRISDEMNVKAAAAISTPDFSIELLKNDDGISLIGLVPLVSDPETIVERVKEIAGETNVSNLLESADFEAPAGWAQALSFGLDALEELPRSKVSISPGRVAITTVAEDEDDKRRLERRLRRDAPNNLRLALSVAAPRPVVAPFTLRFVIDEEGPHFDACSADSFEARRQILLAANEAGLLAPTDCVLGLGTPSTRWGEAAAAAISALGQIGAGSVTLSNADVTLRAAEGVTPAVFDQASGELEAALPPVFSLQAILPTAEDEVRSGETAPPEFTAIRSPEGQVQLRGQLSDETTRAAVESFAAAQFGTANVIPAMRLDETVPAGWPTRVLAAVEALGYLNNGIATVTEDRIAVRGDTGVESARSEITRLLSDKLGGAAEIDLQVAYSEALDPLASIPTPEECIVLLNEAVTKRKITFAPSSTDIEDEGQETIDDIAAILRDCREVEIEIGGHTDSQGREVMNEQLSQARADAVLNAIMARRVLVSNLTARGYGESEPIADNDTEAGREANRRIEFKLVGVGESNETEAEGEAATEDSEAASGEDAEAADETDEEETE
ncbi:MAG: OmpA family protein [Pseudomonadota bacterium]